MSYEYTEVSDETFADQLALTECGLVLIYKDPCPNCKAMKKVIEKYLDQNPKVRILQMDSEANDKSMATLDIAKVPSFLVVREGEIVGKKTGLMNIREFSAFFASH